MPSNTLGSESSHFTKSTSERQSKALKDGTSDQIQSKRLDINVAEVTILTHDKLKAYIDTKPKDDPWSPYTMQNAAACTHCKEHK